MSKDKIYEFHSAIRKGDTQLIQSFIDDSVDINAKNINGDTPLITALRSRKSEIAKLLIEQGADQSMPDKDGKTPIQHAIDENQFEIVNILSRNKGLKLELKYRKIDQDNIGLEAIFAIARKRAQPYINLTNNVYSLDYLSSEDVFNKYKEMVVSIF